MGNITTHTITLDQTAGKTSAILANGKEFEITQLMITCRGSGNLDLLLRKEYNTAASSGAAKDTTEFYLYGKLPITAWSPSTRLLPITHISKAGSDIIKQSNHDPLYFCFSVPTSLIVSIGGAGCVVDIIYNVKYYNTNKDKNKKTYKNETNK